MSCFALEDWIDFVRLTAPPERMTAMQRHLDKGCARCSKMVLMWRSLSELARKARSYEPPESAVRVVRDSYVQHLPPKTPSSVAMVASVIFDSLRQPRLAGARASRKPLPQQLLYAAGEYLVDLRVEGGPKRVSLLGQILNSSKPKEAVKNIAVALVQEGESVAKALTSDSGEFKLHYEPGQDLQLTIALDEGNSIIVPLRDVRPRARRGPGSWPQTSVSADLEGRNPFREH